MFYVFTKFNKTNIDLVNIIITPKVFYNLSQGLNVSKEDHQHCGCTFVHVITFVSLY